MQRTRRDGGSGTTLQRRGFLGVLGAALAAPFVPTPAVEPTPDRPILTVNEARAREDLPRIDVTMFGESADYFRTPIRIHPR